MNMTVLFKKCTYGLLFIATTLIGLGINFSSAVNLPTPDDYYGLIDYSLTPGITYNTTNELGNNHMKILCFGLDNGDTVEFNDNDGLINPYIFSSTAGYSSFKCSYFRQQINSIKITSNKNNVYFDYFDITDSIGNSSCPTCPGINGQCSVSDKVLENIIFSGSKSFNTSYSNMFDYGTEGAGTYCMKFTSSNPQTLTMGFANGPTTTPTNLYSLYNDQYGNTICLYGNKPYLNVKLNSSSNTIDYEVYKLTDLLSDDIPCTQQNCPTYPTCEEQYTSAECQTEYNLIPIEDIDQEYCTSENLCPIIEGTGDVQRSALYINNIQHLGNQNIYIEIPEEIERDYTYLTGETNIDITGYGYDQEKMQSMVNTQFTPPSADDMENIIGKIADFLPLLAIMLLIIYAWRLIKKVF